MDFPSQYTLNGKTYDMAALAQVAKNKNCFEFAYDLNFDAYGRDFRFNAGVDNASGYVKHDFMPDYYNGMVLDCNDPAAFQPLDILIIAYSNPNVRGTPLVQSHQMICLYNEVFDCVHFAGANNVGTLKNELMLSAYTVPGTCVQLFSIPVGREWKVVPGIDTYLQAGSRKFYIFRLPAAYAFPFAWSNNWLKKKQGMA